MASLDRIGADHLRAVVGTYADALELHRAAINHMNVYPVPDGDTGTNMSLTLKSVVAELDTAADDLTAVCTAISHGSLMGARGNSGVILSQILRGLCGVLQDRDGDAAAWSEALLAASIAADGAVMKPVEGTILTVARETARAAATAVADGASLVEMLDRARAAAQLALDRTPEQLAVLAEAGVVDAGGAGYVLLVDALLAVVDGRELPEPPAEVGPVPHGHDRPDDHEPGIADLHYEVMFLLDAPDSDIDGFKTEWASIGDSIVVVGGDGLWNCHIHTDEIGPAIEAGIRVGRPSSIRVTDLLAELEHLESIQPPESETAVDLLTSEPAVTAVVAVAVGPGVRRIFESLGVQAVVTGGQTMNPSTEVLLDAVNQVAADQVVVLPNNKNIIPVAEQVDDLTDKSVDVVPTRGIVEGFASLLAYDPQADLVANHAGMVAAAEGVIAGEVTRAVRDSSVDGLDISAGDWIGIRREGIVAVAPVPVDAMTGLLDAIVDDDHEIVTIIEGADASSDGTELVVAWLAEHRPEAEVEVHNGGQPLYAYYVGVE